MIELEEVERVAALAHLELSPEQTRKLASDLSKILDYIDQLETFPDEEGEAGASLAATPMRDDVVGPSVSLPAIEQNAPLFLHGHFVVPRVIGGES